MEDRIPVGLYLELTDAARREYENTRLRDVLGRPGVERATFWKNQRPNRDEFPRTIPDFETLVVYEVAGDFTAPHASDGVRGLHFRHTPRPAQGTMTGKPTVGLELVFVSPRTPEGARALRDWADFLHIREIAAASVPGFTMITAYENVSPHGPRYMHFYEMDTADAEATFQSMAPATIERLRSQGRDAIKAWTGHSELVIDYVNSFARVGVATP